MVIVVRNCAHEGHVPHQRSDPATAVDAAILVYFCSPTTESEGGRPRYRADDEEEAVDNKRLSAKPTGKQVCCGCVDEVKSCAVLGDYDDEGDNVE